MRGWQGWWCGVLGVMESGEGKAWREVREKTSGYAVMLKECEHDVLLHPMPPIALPIAYIALQRVQVIQTHNSERSLYAQGLGML